MMGCPFQRLLYELVITIIRTDQYVNFLFLFSYHFIFYFLLDQVDVLYHDYAIYSLRKILSS